MLGRSSMYYSVVVFIHVSISRIILVASFQALLWPRLAAALIEGGLTAIEALSACGRFTKLGGYCRCGKEHGKRNGAGVVLVSVGIRVVPN